MAVDVGPADVLAVEESSDVCSAELALSCKPFCRTASFFTEMSRIVGGTVLPTVVGTMVLPPVVCCPLHGSSSTCAVQACFKSCFTLIPSLYHGPSSPPTHAFYGHTYFHMLASSASSSMKQSKSD